MKKYLNILIPTGIALVLAIASWVRLSSFSDLLYDEPGFDGTERHLAPYQS